MTEPKTTPSLHQLLNQEQSFEPGAVSDTPITRETLNSFQSGLGETWLDAVAPQESTKLERRFAWSGIDQNKLRRVFERLDNPEENNDPEEPWCEELALLQASLRQHADQELAPYLAETELGGGNQLPFSDLWAPAVDAAVSRLRSKLEDLNQRSIADSAYESLGKSLLSRLSSISEQVLFEQFNLLRPPGVMLLAHLGADGDGQGPPVREYYERFIREQRRDGLQSLLETFPVLGRFLGQVCFHWRRSNEQLLRRINADGEPLKHFGVEPAMVLTKILQGLSDPHNGGQAVSVLTFSEADSSRGVKVVYKPKDMGVDRAYQEAIEHLNSSSTLTPLRSLTIHCGDDYGFMEHVEHRLCEGDDELVRFYRNAGRLTAVLYVLGCTDCHHENLIACGDQLMLIDTETLLEADLPDHISDASNEQTALKPSDLQKNFQNSVLRSGLLPTWLFVGQAKVAVDISALGIAPPPEPMMKSSGWLGLNSDGMMAGSIERKSDVPTSLPVGIGGTNGLNTHLDTFCEGFREQCAEFERTREDWIKPDGVLDQFRGLPRRIVLRATRVYFALQRQQLEPAALRSPLRQGLVLEQLCRSFLLATDQPLHWPVFEAELRQMERLDIPFFVHGIDGRDLPLIEDLEPVRGFMETSGLESSRQRLETLDTEAVAFQEQLIRGSSNARVTNQKGWSVRDLSVPDEDVIALDPDELRLEARRQLDKLEEIAIHDPDGQLDWLGMDLGSDGEKFSFGPVGLSLYGGTAGVAMLAAQFPDEPTPQALLQSCLKPLLQMGEPDRDGMRLRWWRDQSLGLSGCGGILLQLQQLSLWGGEIHREPLEQLQSSLIAALLPEHISADLGLDVIAGVAGLIGPLLQDGSSKSLEMARLAGEQLLQHQGEDGGWSIGGRGAHPLLGFSHGTAGFATALVKVGQRIGEHRFVDAAARGLAYEREHFNAQQGNWPDYRSYDPEGPDQFMTSWCHGAPGIALSRACLFGTPLWDDKCEDEIGVALKTLTELPTPATDHLCCGTFGNAGILRVVSEGPWVANLPESTLKAAIERSSDLVNRAVTRSRNTGGVFRCFGTSDSNLVLPGGFTGLSGIGMALLDQVNRDERLGVMLSTALLSPARSVSSAPVQETTAQAR